MSHPTRTNDLFDWRRRSWKTTGKQPPHNGSGRGRGPFHFFSLHTFRTSLFLLGSLLLLGFLGTLVVFAAVGRDLPDPETLSTRSVAQSTKMYDRTGQHLLYEIHGEENRTLVKLAQSFCGKGDLPEFDPQNGIPLLAVQATITAEDRHFCEHYGFSLKGILRAVFQNLQGNRYGGSTLTQQLVKQAILSSEKKLSRKIKELILSLEIERRYSKDEILQIYFNEIPYGSTNYGIQSASQHYFAKDVRDLTLSESAALAALPQRPTTLLNNPDLLKSRRDWILDGMVELGYVQKDAAEKAKQDAITIQPTQTNMDAPHFVSYVKQLLEERYGGQRGVEEGGLKVTTTLDWDKQKIAEEEVKKGVEAKGATYRFTNSGLVALDPKTGQILAMVGSKGFWDKDIDGQVNITTRPLQPGSSFKPIVYAAGFGLGYTPNTLLWDVKTDFPTETGPYTPRNYDGKERGPITVRSALQGSLNIPAVKMLYLVGVPQALDFAEKLGYTTFTDRARFGLAIVLGGGEVKLLEHAGAYATFANDGMKQEQTAILRVENADGSLLDEWKPSEGKRIISQDIARLVSNVLSDNAARTPIFGPNSALQLGDRPVAAKTGTTNDYYDAWTVGYTPSLAAGVWVGNNNHSKMAQGADGSVVAAPIWNAFMRRALEGQPIETFPLVEIPKRGKTVLDGGLPSQTVVIDKASGKLATDFTPASYREEKKFAQYHSILHFVNRSDPLGPPPSDPAADPAYGAWEKGVQDWVRAAGWEASTGTPPTEYDDVHLPENIPSLTITSPSPDAVIESRTLTVSAEASAPRGIQRVEFLMDGYDLGVATSYPYVITATIPNAIKRGYHTLTAMAYDDVDNMGSSSIGLHFLSDTTSGGLEITDPRNGQTIERIQPTFSVTLSLDHPETFQYVSLYARRKGNARRSLIQLVSSPSSPFLSIPWTLPEDGTWVLSAHAEGEDQDLETAGITVKITTPATLEISPSE